MRVLICDDEALARQRLKRLLSAMPGVEVVGECADGDEVLSRVAEPGVDLVLLDVQMPKLTGTEALALWPSDGPMVVFCTAYAEHAVKAFDHGALDYVLKPVEPERLAKALARAKEEQARSLFQAEVAKQRVSSGPERVERLPVTTRQGVVLLDPEEISAAVLEDELVTVHAKGVKYLTDDTLQDLAVRLPAGKFERVHRRALLNLAQVARLEPLETGGYFAHTHDGTRVEVSRQSARELRRRLGLRKGADE